jgi:hypothetical protein
MIEYVSVPMRDHNMDLFQTNVDSQNSSRLGAGQENTGSVMNLVPHL